MKYILYSIYNIFILNFNICDNKIKMENDLRLEIVILYFIYWYTTNFTTLRKYNKKIKISFFFNYQQQI